jgi:hypothetical protein
VRVTNSGLVGCSPAGPALIPGGALGEVGVDGIGDQRGAQRGPCGRPGVQLYDAVAAVDANVVDVQVEGFADPQPVDG